MFGLIREFIYKRNDNFDEKTEKDFTTKELNQIFGQANMRPILQFFPGLLAHIFYGVPGFSPFINKGSHSTVKYLTKFESLFWKTWLAYFFSFTTFTVYQKR